MINKPGEKITEIRKIKGLSKEDLAERSGLSLQQVDQIERDKILPSLAPLIKIARVLGVRLGTFLDGDDQTGPVICKKDDQMPSISFSNNNTDARTDLEFYSLAGNKSGRHMEPFMIHVKAGNNKEFKVSSHEGEEFIYILKGCVEIKYGKDIHVLNEGDSIYYDSIVSHHVHAGDNKDALLLAVVYAPL